MAKSMAIVASAKSGTMRDAAKDVTRDANKAANKTANKDADKARKVRTIRKGFSPVISVALLVLISLILALIVNTWGKETVTFILADSYAKYKNTTQAVAGAIFNLFKR